MEIFNFLWLIWDNYTPKAPTKNNRLPWPQPTVLIICNFKDCKKVIYLLFTQCYREAVCILSILMFKVSTYLMNRRKCLQTVHFFHGFVNHVSSRICNDYGWVFPWIWLNLLAQIVNPKSTWDNNHHYFNLWYIKLKKLRTELIFLHFEKMPSFAKSGDYCISLTQD